jgi:ABC-2 type transport system permease protein
MTSKFVAIFWKDVLSATSYRLGFLLQLVGPLFMIVSFFFLSRLLDGASLAGLNRYGGGYFPFVLTGIVFATYTSIFLSTIVSTIRGGQMLGTLELVLTTQTGLTTYLVGSSLYALLRGTIISVIFLGLGALAFGVDFENANAVAGVLALALSLVSVLGLGIMSGSFVLVYKQGDPLSVLVSAGVFLMSGVVYPVEVLPGWLQTGAWALPHTHALEALRLALLQGASVSQLAPQLITLASLGLGILLAGLMFFKYALYRARMEGSFTQY